ncbi:MAG: hypothetical protein RJB58_1631 [Pseudomonadota bacterium]|jgi:probable phosphoglycerate mutase
MGLSLKPGLTLYFARHGQTEANVQKRFQGWARDTALTPLGLTQAADVAAILKRELGEAPSITMVASPLPRARTTMEMVRSALNLSPEGYTTDDRLKEINLGRWDGLTDSEAREQARRCSTPGSPTSGMCGCQAVRITPTWRLGSVSG